MASRGSVRLDMGRLQALKAQVGPRTEEALDTLAVKVQQDAQANIRSQGLIDTGRLFNSIAIQKVGKAVRRIGTAVYYGVFHELGTRRNPARPWLRPARDSAVALARSLFTKVVAP